MKKARIVKILANFDKQLFTVYYSNRKKVSFDRTSMPEEAWTFIEEGEENWLHDHVYLYVPEY